MKIFVRFDDLEDRTTELEKLVDFFIEQKIPVNLGVIPARATKALVGYLNKLKGSYPNLIEIDQHGFEHIRVNKGELDIPDDALKTRLNRGRELMNEYFGQRYSGILTVPWHTHSNNLSRISKKIGFKAISVTYNPSLKAKLAYKIGKILNISSIAGYHLYKGPADKYIKEISPSVDFISSYEGSGKVKDLDTIISEFCSDKRDKIPIGFLIHPQYFKSQSRLNTVYDVFKTLKKDNVEFKKISQLI